MKYKLFLLDLKIKKGEHFIRHMALPHPNIWVITIITTENVHICKRYRTHCCEKGGKKEKKDRKNCCSQKKLLPKSRGRSTGEKALLNNMRPSRGPSRLVR